MSSERSDATRRQLARRVREWSVEEFHDELASRGITRAFVISENGEITLSHPELLGSLKAFFELSQDFADHEGVFIGREEGIPALFIAGVHDTRRGLSQGGLRFKPYENLAELLLDVLRLAHGMTRKNALAGLWWGGGKGVVPMTAGVRGQEYRTEGTPERLELFRAYGRFIASLGGIYYTAEDVGTKTSDLNAVLSQNRFTTCISPALGGSGNPSTYTARGVFLAMRAAWRFLTDSDDLTGVGVAVQGVGNVGGPLVELLDDAGARVWVTDIDLPALEAMKKRRPRVDIVESDAIFDLPADVFAPCAIGAQVNSRTIPRLQVRLICGAANNILEETDDAERLRERGIAYVPDYLCNRMGITNCADEWQGYLEDDVRLAAERVYPDTLRVLRHARRQLITTAAAADQLADIAASELNPLIGHRGRRLVDHLVASDWHGVRRGRRRGDEPRVAKVFDPGSDEPTLRVGWEQGKRFCGTGPTVLAAPVSAAGRPDLSSFLSPLLMDVRVRAIEALGMERPRRVLGSDPGGLALQLAVEQTLPFAREEIGRARFTERCRDVFRSNDVAIREQLHQLGVGFDPDNWLDTVSQEGSEVARRLFFVLEDAGLLKRETRLSYYDTSAQTVLVSPDVLRTRLTVRKRYRVRFTTAEGAAIETWTFFPEMLGGAVALAVDSNGAYGHFGGQLVADPLHLGQELPVFAVEDLSTVAEFLVPSHDRQDHALLERLGVAEELAAGRTVIDGEGLFLVPDSPPLAREEARRLVLQRLGEQIEEEDGTWQVEAFRARRSATLVNLGSSEQLFLDLETAAGHLRRAIETGAVTFSHERWRSRALTFLEELEPWCISRQYWWGQPMPRGPEGEVLSVWFSLAAWSLEAVGWPREAHPEPAAEVMVNGELFVRWALPSQLISFAVTGRPVFHHVIVHGALHKVERVLEPVPEIPQDAPDEERFNARFVHRPLRRGDSVEPVTLIRRFGADALRLGYLLSLPAGAQDVVTLAESHLRRARRAVHRLNSKVTGLLHLSRDLRGSGTGEVVEVAPRLVDHWFLSRVAQAESEAQEALHIWQPRQAAEIFCTVAEEFSSYAAVVAARAHRKDDLVTVRPTLAVALNHLLGGFGPLCPYLCEKLLSSVHSGLDAMLENSEPRRWLVHLVDTLANSEEEATMQVGSPDPEIMLLLEEGRGELEELVRGDVQVVAEPGRGQAVILGPVVVVEVGEGDPPGDDSETAEWYRSLHR